MWISRLITGVNHQNNLRDSDAMTDPSHVLLVYSWRHPSCAQDFTITCFKAFKRLRMGAPIFIWLAPSLLVVICYIDGRIGRSTLPKRPWQPRTVCDEKAETFPLEWSRNWGGEISPSYVYWRIPEWATRAHQTSKTKLRIHQSE
jgi:hypothetical protein